MPKQLTPEQLVEEAFYLFAPDGPDWGQYKRRRADLLGMIREYASQERAAERSRVEGVIKEAARTYSTANAVDEPTLDFLTGAQSCAECILAAIPLPTPEGMRRAAIIKMAAQSSHVTESP